jgi:hypothetical protein
MMETSWEIFGGIIATALGVGAAAIPTGRWLYKRNQICNELETMRNHNQNTNMINVGTDPMQNQLQRMETSIEHIEEMLMYEGKVHHTQTSYLDGLRNEISKLRDEIIDLRIRTGK